MEISDIFLQVVVMLGAAFGNAGATYVPWIWEKTKFQQFDITIFFNKKYLASAAVSFIGCVIFVGSIYSSILAQILAKTPIGSLTYVAAFASAIGIGFAANWGINWVLPSPNQTEKQALEERKALALFEKKPDLLAKIKK